jgi:hypothetical protein
MIDQRQLIRQPLLIERLPHRGLCLKGLMPKWFFWEEIAVPAGTRQVSRSQKKSKNSG